MKRPCGCEHLPSSPSGPEEHWPCPEHDTNDGDAPHGRCSCGEPAVPSVSPPSACNSCRTDGWFWCCGCERSFRRYGLGHTPHVITAGRNSRGDEVTETRCHDCARKKFLHDAELGYLVRVHGKKLTNPVPACHGKIA